MIIAMPIITFIAGLMIGLSIRATQQRRRIARASEAEAEIKEVMRANDKLRRQLMSLEGRS